MRELQYTTDVRVAGKSWCCFNDRNVTIVVVEATQFFSLHADVDGLMREPLERPNEACQVAHVIPDLL